MADEMREYVTFKVTNKEGQEVELAVMDEFEFDHKNYVAAALVEDDTIIEDGVYLYIVNVKGEDFEVEKIDSAEEYARVAEAYSNMEE